MGGCLVAITGFLCCGLVPICPAVEIDVADITSISIKSGQAGLGAGSRRSSALDLIRGDQWFVAGEHRVPVSVVSNLVAELNRPPLKRMDAAQLGLTPEWLDANRERMLGVVGDGGGNILFPSATSKQRAWLTNAFFEIPLIEESVRSYTIQFWVDDWPSVHVSLQHGEDEVMRLSSEAQIPFMVPWKLDRGGETVYTANVDISRGVAAMLPDGFVNRSRILGDGSSVILAAHKRFFHSLFQVRETIGHMVLAETWKDERVEWTREFEFEFIEASGPYERFPEWFYSDFRRTNWPIGLKMKLKKRQIADGKVPGLLELMKGADSLVRPIADSDWLMGLLQDHPAVSISVDPYHSLADSWKLWELVGKAGLEEYFRETVPLAERYLIFTLHDGRDGRPGVSWWMILPDGSFRLLMFRGAGVLDWEAHDLGYRGPENRLGRHSITYVAVHVSSDGRLEKVIPQSVKPEGSRRR